MLNGLTNINIELTDLCNKNCWMCGRRQREKQNPEIMKSYGFMEFSLIERIAEQLPSDIVVQLHNNGEALLYPRFGEVVKLFSNQITNIVTNGKLLVKKSQEIIDNLDTIAISVFENDPESEKQFETVKEFLQIKKDKKPYTIIRCNGIVENINRYEDLGLKIAYRILHSPKGSFDYKRKNPIIPEIGICWDFLHHLAVNKDGDVSICVRFDPKKLGVLGNVKTQTLEEMWNGEKRKEWLEYHKQGRRNLIPLCSYCEFWGVPTG
jgi:radical SAM protein with 4Fe4S-binding SPASM domain